MNGSILAVRGASEFQGKNLFQLRKRLDQSTRALDQCRIREFRKMLPRRNAWIGPRATGENRVEYLFKVPAAILARVAIAKAARAIEHGFGERRRIRREHRSAAGLGFERIQASASFSGSPVIR